MKKIVTAYSSFHFTLFSFQFLVIYFHFTNFVFKIRFYDLLPAEFGIQLMTRQLAKMFGRLSNFFLGLNFILNRDEIFCKNRTCLKSSYLVILSNSETFGNSTLA